MSPDIFKELLEELDGNSVKTLAEKNARYSANGDSLHNFRSGGDVLGGTPAKACWGYMTKHLVALRDMVEKNDFSNREDFLEKCQDTINYIRFLWCIGNDKGEEVGMQKPDRIIRVYSKYNGMLYATFTMDDMADVEEFKDHFIIVGIDSKNNEEFKTMYSFDNFFCTVVELYNGEIQYYRNIDRNI